MRSDAKKRLNKWVNVMGSTEEVGIDNEEIEAGSGVYKIK